jgi:hypothetical protein
MTAAQKVVRVTKEGRSFVLEGDPDEARFNRKLTLPLLGKALPTLLAEGWRVVSTSSSPDGSSLVVLELTP